MIVSIKVPAGESANQIVDRASHLSPAQLRELGVSSVQEIPVTTTTTGFPPKQNNNNTAEDDGWSKQRIMIVAGAGGGGLLLVIILVAMVCYRRSKRSSAGGYHRSFAHQELTGLNEITVRGTGDTYI